MEALAHHGQRVPTPKSSAASSIQSPIEGVRVKADFLGAIVWQVSPRGGENKVLQYVIHRVKVGAHLNDVVEEEYVQRNASQREIEQIIRDPELVH